MKRFRSGYDILSGWKVIRTYRELHYSQWFSIAELVQLQHQRLEKLLAHAGKFVPYYCNILGKVDRSYSAIETLAHLPILSRELLQTFGTDLCDERTGERDKICAQSSGTTGIPIRVFFDRKSAVYSRALEKRGDYEWTNVQLGSKKVTLTTRKKDKKGLSRLAETWRRNWRLSIFDDVTRCFVEDKALTSVVKEITKLKPALIKGNHSSIRKVAEVIVENHLPPVRIKAALSYAELLLDDTKTLVTKAFGCRVYNKYASTEFGAVASECPDGRLHINAERYIVEIVKDGVPVPPGIEGEIVVTDLINFGFPLIRYATGDIGVIATQSCSCGRSLPVLEKISGRTTDFIPSLSGKKILATHIDSMLQEFSHQLIKQVQLFQPALDRIVVRIVPGPDYTPDLNDKVLDKVKGFFPGMGFGLSLEFCDQIIMSKSGKYQFYQRGFNDCKE